MEDFSLIILCKERKHLLSSTLDSLREQKGPFEIIVIGDDELDDPGVRSIVAKGSWATLMNHALHEAKGAYVQFLEPGDRYLSHHGLEFLREVIGQNPSLVLDRDGSTIFRKEKILEFGGFDERLKFYPIQDLLYRFEQKGVQGLICPRVIMESPFQREESVRETWRSLYRYFGMKRALKWLFVDNRTRVLDRAGKVIRQSFWREP